MKIPRGASGTVVTAEAGRGLSDARLLVAWEGLRNANTNVSRGQVEKVPDWSQEHRDYCCKEQQVGCPGPVAQKLANAGEPYGCDTSAEVWDQDEANWCCQNRGLRCALADKHVTPQRPLFNCSTREVWPQAKTSWCCLHEQKGCA